MDNAERLQRGIPALKEDSGLDSCAARRSRQMAAAGDIAHDLSQTAYRCAGAWIDYGENVGEGPSLQAVHNAFMASGDHRRNILDPVFQRMGAGIAWRGGVIYVTEIFVRRPRSLSKPPVSPPKGRGGFSPIRTPPNPSGGGESVNIRLLVRMTRDFGPHESR